MKLGTVVSIGGMPVYGMIVGINYANNKYFVRLFGEYSATWYYEWILFPKIK